MSGAAPSGPGPSVGPDAFNAYYYRHCCGEPYERTDRWLAFFARIADRIVTDVAPKRVLDAGCAKGFLVEALRARGVEAFGLDISEYAISEVDPSVRDYCRVGSITDDLGGDFDLITCIEVVEHMPPDRGVAAIGNLCAHAPDVLFSSSPGDFREPTHVAVRPIEHWAEAFARHGAFRDVDYDATYILPWAARFRRRQEPVHRLIRDYERRHWQLEQQWQGARDHGADLQGQLAEVEHERGRWTHAVHVAHVEHHETALRLAAADARAAAAEAELAGARSQIAAMERSRVWQWGTRLRRLLGR
jgi:2-polyprenyl-3-methyl-5-hydroxy-6-metoxy-1,4-benzoquinol methylase